MHSCGEDNSHYELSPEGKNKCMRKRQGRRLEKRTTVVRGEGGDCEGARRGRMKQEEEEKGRKEDAWAERRGKGGKYPNV